MKEHKIVETIKDIIASPLIRQYRFGLTKRSVQRRRTYFHYGYNHYVIIDTGLSANKAIDLEQKVFNLLTKHSGKRSNLYRKYHEGTRDKNTSKSIGGADTESGELYDLYITWRSHK